MTLKEMFKLDDNKEPIMLWFTIIKNEEEKDEAICYLKGLVEEILLSKKSCVVKIYTEKKLS